jgi:hypothetical protein
VTGLEQQVADRLRELAALAGPAGGATTADRAVALDQTRRRRVVRWGAAVLALCLSATVAGLTRPPAEELQLVGRTTPAGLALRTTPESYRLPPRGSLAGDEDLLAEIADLPWPALAGRGGAVPAPPPETRRVVYAADLPGGHRWAVVIGRAGAQWHYAWYTGPSDADADELSLVTSDQTTRGQVLALVDISDPTGPLVVLAAPGDGAEYSPSLDRAPTGELVRRFDPLPLVDGVPTAVVTTPITWDAGQVHLLRNGTTTRTDVELLTTGTPDDVPVYGPGPPDVAVLTACMTALGLDVEVDLEGGVSWSYGATGAQSSAEQAAQERGADQCWVQATGGA